MDFLDDTFQHAPPAQEPGIPVAGDVDPFAASSGELLANEEPDAQVASDPFAVQEVPNIEESESLAGGGFISVEDVGAEDGLDAPEAEAEDSAHFDAQDQQLNLEEEASFFDPPPADQGVQQSETLVQNQLSPQQEPIDLFAADPSPLLGQDFSNVSAGGDGGFLEQQMAPLAAGDYGAISSLDEVSHPPNLNSIVPADLAPPSVGEDAINDLEREDNVPETIRKWREDNQRNLEEKDAKEKAEKEEWRQKAKRDLEQWYKKLNEQLVLVKTNNLEEQKYFLEKASTACVPGKEWEAINNQCDLNKHRVKDVSRMKSVLLRLKENPYKINYRSDASNPKTQEGFLSLQGHAGANADIDV